MKRSVIVPGVVLVSILLAACSQAVDVDRGNVISGDVENWSGTTATLQPLVTDETGTNVVTELEASATIAGDGSFELTLPETVPSDQLNTLPLCTGEFEGTLEPATWGELFLELAIMQGESIEGFLLQATNPDLYFAPQPGDRAAFRLYVDRDVTASGTCTEPDGFVTQYEAMPDEGWNVVMFEVLAVDGEGSPTSMRVTTPEVVPADMNWYFISTVEPS